MLVDGGGIPTFGAHARTQLDIGEDVVAPYLWERSIRSLDVIALTHAHEDHIGGLPAITGDFHPKELWTGLLPIAQPGESCAAWRRSWGRGSFPYRAAEVPIRRGGDRDTGAAGGLRSAIRPRTTTRW